MPGLPQQRPCPQPVPPALTRGSGRAHSPKPHVVPRVCLPISEREGRGPSPSAREDVVGARCPVPGAWHALAAGARSFHILPGEWLLSHSRGDLDG